MNRSSRVVVGLAAVLVLCLVVVLVSNRKKPPTLEEVTAGVRVYMAQSERAKSDPVYAEALRIERVERLRRDVRSGR